MKRSGEKELWQKNQHVKNHDMGTNSPGLSCSKRDSIPAGEGVRTELPGGSVGGVLGPT